MSEEIEEKDQVEVTFEENNIDEVSEVEVVEEETAEEESLSEEEIDKVADAGIDVLKTVLSHFDSAGAEINEYEGDEGEVVLDVVGGDLGILIGRRGHTLEALQTLTSAIAHHQSGVRYPISVDVESYKYRMGQRIERMAKTAADRALRQDREVKLDPMSAYERRLVHMALRDDSRVETHSIGKDPQRRVVVTPV